MSAPETDASHDRPAAGWTLCALDETVSTNRYAAQMPPWTAVTARIQTGGRGRHGRHWVSDDGGLWLSAVVPLSDAPHNWGILPLAAGWAACQALQSFGLAGIRLRWPNDVMIANTKLAGILVERFRPTTAVVGIGVNCHNRPAQAEPSLAGTVARLADLATPPPSVAAVRDAILDSLHQAHAWIAGGTPDELAAALAPFWRNGPVAATLRPGGETIAGLFAGVDAAGRLQLLTDDGATRWLAPADVELLREIETT